MIWHMQPKRRPSITLVELLVVIAILVILAGLVSAGLFKWIDTQRQSNTNAIIQKVQKHLDLQIKKVLEDASNEKIPASVLNLAGGDPIRARVIWKKLRLKQEFPNTLAEAKAPYKDVNGTAVLSATDLPPIASYATAANKIATGASDSAALLVLILARNRGAGTINADDLGSAAIDVNGDGYKEVVDGWGNPVQFYRWPTASAAVDALRPTNSVPFRDPLDPSGTLLNATWYGAATQLTTNAQFFESLCHKIKPPTATGGGSNGAYLIPVIVSSGRDGVLGLDTTTLTVTNATGAADNIYSYALHQ